MAGPAIIRLTAQPRLLTDGSLATLRMAGGGNRANYYLGGNHYRGGVVDLPRFSATFGWDDAGWNGSARPQLAPVVWSPSLKATYSDYANLYLWKDAPLTAEIGFELENAATAGVEPTSTQWRLLFDTTLQSGGYVGIAELEMRATAGGADQCSGGTASASSTFSGSYLSSNAFDNSTSNLWHSNGESSSWLQYTFASAVSVKQLAINARNDTAENGVAPRNFQLQYWNGGSWTTTATFTTGTWATGEQRLFTDTNVASSAGSVQPTSWTTLLTGVVQAISAQSGQITLQVTDNAGKLDKPVASGHFAGTGNIEGPAEAEGREKRRSFGYVFNVEGRILDKANNVYEFGDPAFPFQSFVDVKDMGRSASPAFTTVAWQGTIAATLAALQLATAPVGSCVVAPSIACVKWWTVPQGPLTADIIGTGTYGNTAVALAQQLATDSGITMSAVPATVSSLMAGTANAGVHVGDDGTTVAQALDRLLLGSGVFWRFSPAGTLDLMPIAVANPVLTITADNIERQRVFLPHKKRRLGYKRNERQHSDAEVSAALLESDPNVLTVASKKSWLAGQDADLEGRYTFIRARLVELNLSTIALDAARTDWRNLLASYSPAWNDLDNDTTIFASAVPESFPASPWSGSAQQAANGLYTVLTDSSATVFQSLVRQVLLSDIPNKWVSGSGYLLMLAFPFLKDAVAGTTRRPLIRIVCFNASNAVLSTAEVSMDTKAGTSAVWSGAPVDSGIYDSGSEWLLRVGVQTPAGTSYVWAEIYPAAGTDAAGYSVAATGSVNVRKPLFVNGGWGQLGRYALMGKLNEFSAQITAAIKAVSATDAQLSNFVDGPKTTNVQYYSDNVAVALPTNALFKLKNQAGQITTGITWKYVVLSGTINGHAAGATEYTDTIANDSGTGVFTVNSLNATSKVEIRAYVGTTFWAYEATFTRENIAQSSTGGGGGGGGGGSSNVVINGGASGTTFAIKATVTVTATDATINLDASITVMPGSSAKGYSVTVEAKWQRVTGGVADISGVASATATVDSFNEAQPGDISVGATDSGRTVGVAYTYQLVARCTAAAKNAVLYGSATATP